MWEKRFVSIVLLSGFLGAGCSDRPPQNSLERFSESRPLLGTTVKIDVCHEKARRSQVERAVDKVWQRVEEISAGTAADNEDSDLARLNRAFPDSAQVSNDTYHLIKNSIDYARLTGGAFDVTVGPLHGLWKESVKKNALPAAADIERIRSAMGSRMISLLADHRVRLNSAATKLDPGGLIDGFAADEAARTLRVHGFFDFLIDTGGELYAAGTSCEGRKWRVGVRDPLDSNKILEVVELHNQAVATATGYERAYEIGGKHWPQILDPKTGYPPPGMVSATVIGSAAESCEALSQALFAMAPADGKALIDSLGPEWASLSFIKNKGGKLEALASRNYEKFRGHLYQK